MPLAAGARLGPYEILSPLGAGGMGEVYRARDTRLKREVAVKVLPALYSENPERVRRFAHEAESASALNHPNILAIYDIGTHEGAPYIVSELLEGNTLRAPISDGPFTPRRAIGHALQIAQGLAAAHEKGIVHRDLKPENIFVTNDGRVKILDFGLAKLTQPEGTNARQTNLPTVTPGTEPGVVMGTLGYISPEQVRGKPADARSDIFSFGAILYEMLSGRRAFHGETAADTVSAILTKEPPDLSETNHRIPESLDRIVRHCLEKSPEARFHSASDVAFDLEAVSAGSGSLTAPVPAKRSRLRFIAVAVVTGALGVGLFYAGRRSAPATRGRSTSPNYTRLTNLAGREYAPALSPDGKVLAFVKLVSGKLDVWVQRAGGRKPTDLTSDCDRDSYSPAFSPDGNLIAYGSQCGGAGLFLMGATGENARKLTNVGTDPAWSPDGREIVYTTEIGWSPYGRLTTSELWAADVSTGKPRRLFAGDAVQPSVSPHGLRVAYWGLRSAGSQRDIWTIPFRGLRPGEKPVAVTEDPAIDWNPVWSPDGRFLWFLSNRDGAMNLWRVPIDEGSGRVLGAPEPRTLPAAEVGGFSLSRDGRRLAYVVSEQSYSIARVGYDVRAARFQGTPVEVLQTAQEISSPVVSPDGQWIAFDSQGGPQEDLFLVRTDGTGLRQLTDDPPRDRIASFSPDGRRLVFMSDRSGDWELWTVLADGSGLSQLTRTGEAPTIPLWSPDGKRIAASNVKGGDVFLFELDEKGSVGKTTKLPRPPGDLVAVALGWTSDGRRLIVALNRADSSLVKIAIFSLDHQSYDPAPTPPRLVGGRNNSCLILGDRLLWLTPDGLYASELSGPGGRLLLRHPPTGSYVGLAASSDGTLIYLLQSRENADIWQATLP